MELKEDPDSFDEWQSYFSYEILRIIKDKLSEAALPRDQVRDLSESIGFSLSTLLDGSSTFSVDGTVLTPMLTFSKDDGVLVHQGSPSDLHEYVFGNLDELFDDQGAS
jgi:hypothetical protein